MGMMSWVWNSKCLLASSSWMLNPWFSPYAWVWTHLSDRVEPGHCIIEVFWMNGRRWLWRHIIRQLILSFAPLWKFRHGLSGKWLPGHGIPWIIKRLRHPVLLLHLPDVGVVQPCGDLPPDVVDSLVHHLVSSLLENLPVGVWGTVSRILRHHDRWIHRCARLCWVCIVKRLFFEFVNIVGGHSTGEGVFLLRCEFIVLVLPNASGHRALGLGVVSV